MISQKEFRKAMEEIYNDPQDKEREWVIWTTKEGLDLFDKSMIDYVSEWDRKELRKRNDDLFRHHDVTLEEYQSLSKMIMSKDRENLEVARALINELYKRPRLYPQWKR